MIEYIEGNIFNSPAQVIVNTVNTGQYSYRIRMQNRMQLCAGKR